MKKNLVSILFSILLLFSFSIPVFASTDSGTAEEETFTFESIGDFIKDLFIPSDRYFERKTNELGNKFNSKIGGLSTLYSMLSSFWSNLGNDTGRFVFSLPAGHFAPGAPALTINLFDLPFSAPFLSLLRGVGNAFIVLLTAIACFHKLRILFAKDGGN